MILPNAPVIHRMQSFVAEWESQSDQRSIFLSCYMLMTGNMLTAVDQKEFSDPQWVDGLLHAFADYYFIALDTYNLHPTSAPPVWKLAHDACRDPSMSPLQKLLLGVNAHINYDLVLTLVDLLRPEWPNLQEERRKVRYQDHCLVNDIIGRTIDTVQDTILEPSMPIMDIIDNLLGPLDEYLISRLISGWRENVWKNATRLIEIQDLAEQHELLKKVEKDSMRTGSLISWNRGKPSTFAFG
jgi:hypothetical protein